MTPMRITRAEGETRPPEPPRLSLEEQVAKLIEHTGNLEARVRMLEEAAEREADYRAEQNER